jgi:uncharacterized protein (DUF4415 family)
VRKEYDFSTRKKNAHAERLRKSVTIRLDVSVIAYFKAMSDEVGIPYQTLVNLYLRDCAANNRRLNLDWNEGASGTS